MLSTRLLVINDFASIQRSLVPSVNLATADNMNRRIQVIEQLVSTHANRLPIKSNRDEDETFAVIE